MEGGVNLTAVVLKSTVERSDGPSHQEKGAFGEDVWGDGVERNGLQVREEGPSAKTRHQLLPELAPLGAV